LNESLKSNKSDQFSLEKKRKVRDWHLILQFTEKQTKRRSLERVRVEISTKIRHTAMLSYFQGGLQAWQYFYLRRKKYNLKIRLGKNMSRNYL
jgi:hypothetical protein